MRRTVVAGPENEDSPRSLAASCARMTKCIRTVSADSDTSAPPRDTIAASSDSASEAGDAKEPEDEAYPPDFSCHRMAALEGW